ncbi:hypothetical protein F4803DRAFT_557956 [Xylaria telfairii]|nr:hypothetical protein F4803DRAFT_557956 [Xylaria telfairii]
MLENLFKPLVPLTRPRRPPRTYINHHLRRPTPRGPHRPIHPAALADLRTAPYAGTDLCCPPQTSADLHTLPYASVRLRGPKGRAIEGNRF